MKQIPECRKRYDLDMETLVWTRGPNFPLSRLSERMMCVRYGSRRVSLIFHVPAQPMAKRA